jgi:MGT family glycosyltransferase
VLTSEAFDFVAPRLPENVRYVGPRLLDPVWSEGWAPPPGDAPLVLVGLSSTFQDQLPLLRRVTEALGRIDVRGVVTTGPAIDPADVPAPPNVTVVRSAPHREVLRHAAAVVTHAGHGTTMKALAAGVPVVAVPMGRDQLEVAVRLVARGAGVRVSPRAGAAKLAAAVQRVLDRPEHRHAAQRLAAAIGEESAHDRAADELEALARTAVPA